VLSKFVRSYGAVKRVLKRRFRGFLLSSLSGYIVANSASTASRKQGPQTEKRWLSMVRVAPGSRPPSWSQNEVKVLIDAESSLYSSSIETPGPARPWRENVTRPRSSAGLPRLYPFWIIPSDLFPLLCLPTPYLSFCLITLGCSAQPRDAASPPGAPGAPARCSRRLAYS